MNTNLRNNIAGAIYGFAIGDAMGATTEFMTHLQIRKQFHKVENIIGGGWLHIRPGQVTDDTEMTMCVMDALMHQPHDEILFEMACAKNFKEWYKSNPKDIGAQCSKAIHCLLSEGKKIGYDAGALGNGSLMRAMPCALLGLDKFNEIQGALTHNNSTCSSFIQNYSELIQRHLYNKNITYITGYLLEPSGYIRNTFNNSVYWSQEDSFEDAIIKAVNHGGDADTIAAITGSLAGAKFGYDAIPERWINQLNPDVKIFLEKFKIFVFTYLQI